MHTEAIQIEKEMFQSLRKGKYPSKWIGNAVKKWAGEVSIPEKREIPFEVMVWYWQALWLAIVSIPEKRETPFEDMIDKGYCRESD